jgi:hypothetical protein
MNTVRMFVFAIALLSTAFLLRVITDYFSTEQAIHAAESHGTDVPAGELRAADSGSR